VTGTRRLAAILAADVVGYSRLMGEDEAGTAKVVRERREAAGQIVRSLGGRLVKTTGDGVLLEFPSVVAAVESAILIQKMMAERNERFLRPDAFSIAPGSISATFSSTARTSWATGSTSPRASKGFAIRARSACPRTPIGKRAGGSRPNSSISASRA
jgi:hypothetical protein